LLHISGFCFFPVSIAEAEKTVHFMHMRRNFMSQQAFRFACIRLLPLFFLFVCAMPAEARSGLPEFTDLAEKAGKAVVNISTIKNVEQNERMRDFFRLPRQGTPFDDFFDQFDRFFGQQQPQQRPRKQRSLGSGFIISQDGFIVTNNHVIAEADEIEINLQGVEKPVKAEIIGRDPDTDLALIKIDYEKRLPVLKFGNSDRVKVGQWVMAIGNPFGLDHTVTAGIVSAKGRIIGTGPFDDFIQTDASINPGNSGGPLLNLDGEVVAINTAIIASGQGIGFAVPSNMARKVIDQLKDKGEVRRGWLGVTIQDVDENTAKALDLDEPKGALIASVLAGQPAEKAGVETGDVIIKVEGQEVADANILLRKIASFAPGEKVDITVWRKGREKDLTVTLGMRDPQVMAEARDGGGQGPQDAESELGLAMRPVTREEAEALNLSGANGLLVTAVDDASVSAESDIRPGDVILEVNQRQVNSVDEFRSIMSGEGKAKGVLLLLIQRSGQSVFRTITLPGNNQ
jgi:serine protease Do